MCDHIDTSRLVKVEEALKHLEGRLDKVDERGNRIFGLLEKIDDKLDDSKGKDHDLELRLVALEGEIKSVDQRREAGDDALTARWRNLAAIGAALLGLLAIVAPFVHTILGIGD